MPGSDQRGGDRGGKRASHLSSTELARARGHAGFRLTDEMLERIIGLIRIGNYIETACAAAGIGRSTYARWMNTGEAVDAKLTELLGEDHGATWDSPKWQAPPPGLEVHANEWQCWKLREAALIATAEAEAYAVGIVRKHMPDQWQAAMTFLERKHPGRWRRTDRHEIAQATPVEDDAAERALLNSPEAIDHLHAALEEGAQAAEAARRKALPPGFKG